MLRRMVLSDCRRMPWLRIRTFFLELLDIKLIQLERRLSFKTYWTGPCVEHLAMPRNASLVPERGHVVAFSR